MPKKFITFLAIAQTCLTLWELLIYKLLISLLPALAPYQTVLFWATLVMSFGFLIFSFLGYRRDKIILRIGYLISVLWIVWTFYFCLAALVIVLLYPVTKNHWESFGQVAFLIATLLVIYGLINARMTKVISLKIALPNLPAHWQGKTAVLASDLHLGQILRTGTARKIVKLINRQRPEVVFIPGDFYDGVHTGFQELANEFKNIDAAHGTYFCSGNHEMLADYSVCEHALKQAGIKILENQKVELFGLQIAGVAYTHATIPELAQILADLKLDPKKPSILLKHVPSQLKEAAEAGIDLQLSGHSHRGQIWPGSLITKRVWKTYDYGYKKLHNMHIYISSGTGTWGPPLRIFTRSEIVKIIFE